MSQPPQLVFEVEEQSFRRMSAPRSCQMTELLTLFQRAAATLWPVSTTSFLSSYLELMRTPVPAGHAGTGVPQANQVQ